MITTIVNKKLHHFDIYIGRGSKWGNPFSHIPGKGIYCKTRNEAIQKYEEYIRNKPELLQDLHELKGKTLGCFCKPLSCHGDVLIKLIKELG